MSNNCNDIAKMFHSNGSFGNLFEVYPCDFYDVKLYKIIKYEHALPILLEDKIRMDVIHKAWPDKHELFYFKQNYQSRFGAFGGTTIDLMSLVKNIYGQCWSFSNKYECAWKCYGEDDMMVRLTTSLGKLIDFFYKQERKFEKNTFMDRVVYKSQDQISEWMHTNINEHTYNNQDLMVQSLFIKRDCFSYENEFRIVIAGIESSLEDYIVIENNNVKDLISEIEFDSRIDDSAYNKIKENLENKLKDAQKNNVKIFQSDIYQPIKVDLFNV